MIHVLDSKTRKIKHREYYHLDRDPRQRQNLVLDDAGRELSRELTRLRRDAFAYRVEFPAERRTAPEIAELLAARSPDDATEEDRRHQEALEALGYVE